MKFRLSHTGASAKIAMVLIVNFRHGGSTGRPPIRRGSRAAVGATGSEAKPRTPKSFQAAVLFTERGACSPLVLVSDFPGVSRGGALQSEGVGLSAVTGQDSAQFGLSPGPFRKHFSKDFKAT